MQPDGIHYAKKSAMPPTNDVFAPTDAAFKAVPKATLNKLAADRNALRRVLLYHVVKGDVTAAKVVKLRSAKSRWRPRST